MSDAPRHPSCATGTPKSALKKRPAKGGGKAAKSKPAAKKRRVSFGKAYVRRIDARPDPQEVEEDSDSDDDDDMDELLWEGEDDGLMGMEEDSDDSEGEEGLEEEEEGVEEDEDGVLHVVTPGRSWCCDLCAVSATG